MARRHGTLGGYIDGCRCTPCENANAYKNAGGRREAVPWLPAFTAADDSWMQRGECRRQGLNPEDFYPGKGATGQRALKKAIAVCAECPDDVRWECLQFALENRIEFGVWGGLSGKGRDGMKPARRQRSA